VSPARAAAAALLLAAACAAARAAPSEGLVWAELRGPAAGASPAFLQSTRWELRGGSPALFWRRAAAGGWEWSARGMADGAWFEAVPPQPLAAPASGEVAGHGWLETPAGPVRALLLRREIPGPGGSAFLYQWAGPGGTLAWLLGPPGAGPFFRAPESAGVVVRALQGVNDLRLRYDAFPDLDPPVLAFGYHAEDVATADLLADQDPASLGALVAQAGPGFWDFSGAETASVPAFLQTYVTTQVPADAGESCYAGRCGFASSGFYRRTDTLPPDYQQLIGITQNGSDSIVVRALVDVTAGSGGLVCFDQSPVFPLAVFGHPDPGGAYMAEGDAWQTGVFDCPPSGGIDCTCAGCGTDVLLGSNGDHSGRASFTVLDAGTVRLPSGHYLDALLVRIDNDFAGFAALVGCFDLFSQDANATWYFWLAPGLGPVVQLVTAMGLRDPDAAPTVEALVAAGLLPPVAIAVEDAPPAGVRVLWEPGELPPAAPLDGFVVWWGVAGGPLTDRSALLPPDARELRVEGLQCDTVEYDFAVQSVATWTDPSTSVATTYATPLPPGSPFEWTDRWTDPLNWSVQGYPAVVRVRPGCACPPPDCPATDLRLAREGAGLRLRWGFGSDPCLEGFSILRSQDDCASLAPFAEIHAAPPADRDALVPLEAAAPPRLFYYLVRPTGPGGAPGCLERYGETVLCDPACL